MAAAYMSCFGMTRGRRSDMQPEATMRSRDNRPQNQTPEVPSLQPQLQFPPHYPQPMSQESRRLLVGAPVSGLLSVTGSLPSQNLDLYVPAPQHLHSPTRQHPRLLGTPSALALGRPKMVSNKEVQTEPSEASGSGDACTTYGTYDSGSAADGSSLDAREWQPRHPPAHAHAHAHAHAGTQASAQAHPDTESSMDGVSGGGGGGGGTTSRRRAARVSKRTTWEGEECDEQYGTSRGERSASRESSPRRSRGGSPHVPRGGTTRCRTSQRPRRQDSREADGGKGVMRGRLDDIETHNDEDDEDDEDDEGDEDEEGYGEERDATSYEKAASARRCRGGSGGRNPGHPPLQSPTARTEPSRPTPPLASTGQRGSRELSRRHNRRSSPDRVRREVVGRHRLRRDDDDGDGNGHDHVTATADTPATDTITESYAQDLMRKVDDMLSRLWAAAGPQCAVSGNASAGGVPLSSRPAASAAGGGDGGSDRHGGADGVKQQLSEGCAAAAAAGAGPVSPPPVLAPHSSLPGASCIVDITTIGRYVEEATRAALGRLASQAVGTASTGPEAPGSASASVPAAAAALRGGSRTPSPSQGGANVGGPPSVSAQPSMSYRHASYGMPSMSHYPPAAAGCGTVGGASATDEDIDRQYRHYYSVNRRVQRSRSPSPATSSPQGNPLGSRRASCSGASCLGGSTSTRRGGLGDKGGSLSMPSLTPASAAVAAAVQQLTSPRQPYLRHPQCNDGPQYTLFINPLAELAPPFAAAEAAAMVVPYTPPGSLNAPVSAQADTRRRMDADATSAEAAAGATRTQTILSDLLFSSLTPDLALEVVSALGRGVRVATDEPLDGDARAISADELYGEDARPPQQSYSASHAAGASAAPARRPPVPRGRSLLHLMDYSSAVTDAAAAADATKTNPHGIRSVNSVTNANTGAALSAGASASGGDNGGGTSPYSSRGGHTGATSLSYRLRHLAAVAKDAAARLQTRGQLRAAASYPSDLGTATASPAASCSQQVQPHVGTRPTASPAAASTPCSHTESPPSGGRCSSVPSTTQSHGSLASPAALLLSTQPQPLPSPPPQRQQRSSPSEQQEQQSSLLEEQQPPPSPPSQQQPQQQQQVKVGEAWHFSSPPPPPLAPPGAWPLYSGQSQAHVQSTQPTRQKQQYTLSYTRPMSPSMSSLTEGALTSASVAEPTPSGTEAHLDEQRAHEAHRLNVDQHLRQPHMFTHQPQEQGLRDGAQEPRPSVTSPTRHRARDVSASGRRALTYSELSAGSRESTAPLPLLSFVSSPGPLLAQHTTGAAAVAASAKDRAAGAGSSGGSSDCSGGSVSNGGSCGSSGSESRDSHSVSGSTAPRHSAPGSGGAAGPGSEGSRSSIGSGSGGTGSSAAPAGRSRVSRSSRSTGSGSSCSSSNTRGEASPAAPARARQGVSEHPREANGGQAAVRQVTAPSSGQLIAPVSSLHRPVPDMVTFRALAAELVRRQRALGRG